MSTGSPWGLYFVALLVLLAGLLAPSGLSGPPSEAAQATPPPQATALRGAGRVGQSPTLWPWMPLITGCLSVAG